MSEGPTVDDTSGIMRCGTKPKDHDPTLKSDMGKCPHCGKEELVYGFGLAAGGCGSYQICGACDRFCDSVQDS